MESKDVGGIFVGRRMSRAFQRAKERQNRSSDELVMDETNFERSQFLQVADVRKWTDVRSTDVRSGRKSSNFSSGLGFQSSGRGRMSGGSWGFGRPESEGRLVGRGQREMRGAGRDFGRNFGILGAQIEEISWMKDGETWGYARST